MTDTEARLASMIEVALRGIEDLKQLLTPKAGPMTRAAFAKATGYSVRTIQRKIEAKEIRVVDGRIPASELRRFLS